MTQLNRRDVLHAGMGALAAAALAGCVSQTNPTTQPTTQPTAEDNIFAFASQSLAVAEQVWAVASATGLVPAPDVALGNAAQNAADAAVTAWGQVLDQPAGVQAQKIALAAIAGFLPFVVKAHATANGTTPAAIKARYRLKH